METILTDEELAALLDMVIERVRADLGNGQPLRLKEISKSKQTTKSDASQTSNLNNERIAL